MIVGPGEADRWLETVLKQRTELVDDMIIATNNATQKEKDLIKKYGFWQYEDNREWGINQPLIKNDLLAKAVKLKPDWFLPSDADELYGKAFTRAEAERLAATDAISYNFHIINLWGDQNHYRHDLSFENIRYFRFRPELGLSFERKNVHCGWSPPAFYTYAWTAPHLVKHYGLMLEKDRKRKVERYEKYDPKAVFKGKEFYDKIAEKEIAGRPFIESEMQMRCERNVQDHYKHQHLKHVSN